MACILKLPTRESKGVVIFTTFEINHVYSPADHADLLEELKDRWILGLHYNGPQKSHPPIFDFAIAGPDFVEELNGKPLVTIDAGKLAPPCFAPSRRENHWDILYVARCTRRKNVEFFFKCIKRLYNRGFDYRVLLIATVPENPGERFPPDPAGMYTNLFSKAERDRFTFLPLYHNLPFPLDRETLAEFYKSSLVFVHPSTNEQGRARNVGYAWASELPVVGLNLYNLDLEERGLKQPPYYYEAESYDEIPRLLIKAVEEHRSTEVDLSPIREVFSITHTQHRLKSEIVGVFEQLEEPFVDGSFFFDNLDIRIARHHGMESDSNNTFACSFGAFLRHLRDPAALENTIEGTDPEEDIAKSFFNRTVSKRPEPPEEVTLPTPSSEQSTPFVQLLKRYHLYRLARIIHGRSTLAKKIYRALLKM